MDKTRKEAFLILNNILNKDAFLNEELIRLKNINKRDYNFIVNLVRGVLENKLLIDNLIRNYSKIRIKKIHPAILIILELCIYQMFFMDKIPAYSAINESVDLAKEFGNRGSVGFTNGILRNILRNSQEIISSDYNLDIIKSRDYSDYLSKKYSHPKFFVDYLLKDHDKNFVEDLLISNNKKAPFFIRVNNLKVDLNEFIKSAENKGYKLRPTKLSEKVLEVLNPEGIFDTDLFKRGYFYVQDLASVLVAELSDIGGGSKILDLCASPGGKSFNFSMLYPDSKIISCDISKKKVNLIEENKKRLGIRNIDIKINDASRLKKEFIGNFDFVLVDAPCSGLGLYRRKVEIRYNTDMSDVESLKIIQKKILTNALKYLNSHGNLTYSTCTLTKEENEEVVREVLNENKDFEIERTCGEEFKRFYPNIDNTDGFTMCRLKRKIWK
ncbi:16S rRNA (cytosine(967)-C(5))-methyltransferase RsmB [Peptoniphilus catoniae]|uniref:16S rRNA (cytosine(967)-C(5))-methyltransferase RsmB n=1 Tax=Peptoniphilus catoniae TaxID=1660341 RepID=UPI0010FDED4F|nr:16S rRNA (cytosine(967)-C(5))-methyltransferase RsmB [Peptoniphilus catoniae]